MIEKTILRNLVHNEDFIRKVGPFLSETYFKQKYEKVIFEIVHDFFMQYNRKITSEILEIELGNRKDLNQSEFRTAKEFVKDLTPEAVDFKWLVDSTEQWCRKAAIFHSLVTALAVYEGRDKSLTEYAIPEMMQEALNTSFETNIGHDYIEDAESRYEYYHRTEERLPFDIDLLNKITKGGMIRKTLNVIMAETGAGKTAFLCHLAAATLKQGYNVLYITLEMSEEKISERIDANLMGVNINDIEHFDKDHYLTKIDKIKAKSTGKLIVKEYPTSSVHAGHFRALLEELRVKKDFEPALVIVDYINICTSSRVRLGSAVNTNTYIKSISEELRALAVEYGLIMFSATQTNRGGYSSSDISMTDTSESIGLTTTLDLFLAMMAPEELQALNQVMFKQLKNRYNDPSFFKRFVVGFDRPKMTFYNLEESAQSNIAPETTGRQKGGSDLDKPIFDSSTFGGRMKQNRDYGDFNFGDEV